MPGENEPQAAATPASPAPAEESIILEKFFPGSLKLRSDGDGLEEQVSAGEGEIGKIHALEIAGTSTVARYTLGDFPAAIGLKLLLTLGDTVPPAPPGCTFLFIGDALVLTAPSRVAVFRPD